MSIVLHLALHKEGQMVRSDLEKPFEGDEDAFVVLNDSSDLPLKAKVLESTGEFDHDQKEVLEKPAILFAHTLPEALDVDGFITQISQEYCEQVSLIRVLKRQSLYPLKLSDAPRKRKDSIIERPLLSIVIIFKKSLYARNFYEHMNCLVRTDCSEPLLFQFISHLHVGLLQPPTEMSEEFESKAPSSQGLLKLPYCLRCLLLLDETFSGIEATPGPWEKSGWPESSKLCQTCFALSSMTSKCSECASQEDIWICLHCGIPGCGRYAGAHSLEHYLNSHHNFSVNCEGNIIWSYATDNFVHRVKDKSQYWSHGGDEVNSRAVERQENLLEQNISSMLCEQLDMQRAYFENKLEAKREELNQEVCVTADLKAKDLSLKKELVKKELENKRNQYSTLRKARFSVEQKIASVKRLLEEEESVRNNLESHVAYIDTEDDPVLATLDKEIESQSKLLADFEKKLAQMYDSLS